MLWLYEVCRLLGVTRQASKQPCTYSRPNAPRYERRRRGNVAASFPSWGARRAAPVRQKSSSRRMRDQHRCRRAIKLIVIVPIQEQFLAPAKVEVVLSDRLPQDRQGRGSDWHEECAPMEALTKVHLSDHPSSIEKAARMVKARHRSLHSAKELQFRSQFFQRGLWYEESLAKCGPWSTGLGSDLFQPPGYAVTTTRCPLSAKSRLSQYGFQATSTPPFYERRTFDSRYFFRIPSVALLLSHRPRIDYWLRQSAH
jgi:hypothetical protein